MNPELFSTRLIFSIYTKVEESEIINPGLVVSPEILNPELKVGNLNPKTFESGDFCQVNDLLSNPSNFPPAIF